MFRSQQAEVFGDVTQLRKELCINGRIRLFKIQTLIAYITYFIESDGAVRIALSIVSDLSKPLIRYLNRNKT